jgi:hypothetical protein
LIGMKHDLRPRNERNLAQPADRKTACLHQLTVSHLGKPGVDGLRLEAHQTNYSCAVCGLAGPGQCE